MDHLLSITNGRGGGVEGCKGVSPKLKEILEKDYERIKRAKEVKDSAFKQKLQQIITPHFLQAWLELEVHLNLRNQVGKQH